MKGSFGGGVDLMYDRSMLKRKPELGAPIRAGLTFAYEIHIGKMSIPIQQGIYVFDMFKKDTFFYQRIGWRYHINKEFIAQFTLKSHLFVADYAELGIGYTFKQ
jgi:CTP synthase (UTP-ammonia lyase)